MRHRRPTWLLWTKEARRQRDLELAQARDDAEHQAAVARILAASTAVLPVFAPKASRCSAPLLTPGQADRSKHDSR